MTERNTYSPRANLNFFTLSLACQAIGFACASLFASAFPPYWFLYASLHLLSLLTVHSLSAFFVARWLKLPLAWLVFNLLIAPAVILYGAYNLPTFLIFAAFAISFLMYIPTFWTRIPYYPTSLKTYNEVLSILPKDQDFKMMDLGSGFASMIFFLAKKNPKGTYYGTEISPLPFVISYLRSKIFRYKNVRIQYKSFWSLNFADYNFIYCFLAPGPMEKLWIKIKNEMKSGSTFVTNSFPVPAKASQIIEIYDKKSSKLFVHKL